MKDINDIIMNPIRMRIIQFLSKVKKTTTNELCKNISDIPRTTIYRHIKILIDNNIVKVISEQKIRGSSERTIALNIQEITKHNTVENGAQNAFGFLMNNYGKFEKYFNSSNPNPSKDKIFLNNTILMMSDKEFNQFLESLRELILRFDFESSVERKPRDISIISAPVEKN